MLARFSAALIGSVTAIALLTGARDAESNHSSSQLPDRLPRRESADFVLAAMRAELEPGYRKRGLGLDFDGTQPNSHFYTWMVIPSWGQGVDYFAVDRRTGDVWADLGCGLIQSHELAILQAHFRRRFDVPAWRVRQIEKEGFPGNC
jgi:hypothetical protein